MIRLIVLCSFFLATIALAEDEPARGRLPDGRAFRTTDDGTQLVDYIAELEVNVESLNRQVQGLEDQIRDQQQVIDRLQSGKSANAHLTERNLNQGGVAAARVNTQCEPKVIERVVERASPCLPVECPPSGQSVDCSGAIEAALKKQRQEDRETIARQENEIVDLKIAVNNARAAHTGAGTRFAGASIRVPGGASETRIRAVDTLRNSMRQDLRSLEGLISYRDQLYRRVDKRRHRDTIKIPVKELESRLSGADQVVELSRLRSQINEWRGKVQHEIALYKRELKIR